MSYVQDSTLRTCDWPGCFATYDATTGPRGQTAERHWRNHPTFGLHLCGDHSPAWGSGDGPHAPHLNHGTQTSVCNCGALLPGMTLGDMSDAYLIHLARIAQSSP